MEGGRDEDTQEEEEGLGDHCMHSVGLVNAHPPEGRSEAPKLIVSAGEAICV